MAAFYEQCSVSSDSTQKAEKFLTNWAVIRFLRRIVVYINS